MKKVNTKTKSNKVSNIRALIDKTCKENPKPEDLTALRKEFDEKPALYRSFGNIQKSIFDSIVNDAVAKSALMIESVERFTQEMKTELGYENSTFVEKMLIDEIILRWMRLVTVENQHHANTKSSHTLTVGIYWDKRLNASQHRYLRSIESLAKVRKMIAQTQAKGAKMFKDLMSSKEK